jgi:hypothetical protein
MASPLFCDLLPSFFAVSAGFCDVMMSENATATGGAPRETRGTIEDHNERNRIGRNASKPTANRTLCQIRGNDESSLLAAWHQFVDLMCHGVLCKRKSA